MSLKISISLRPYGEDDFAVLQSTMGDPAMTTFLGGPESAEKLQARHARYVALQETDHDAMFVILAGPQQTPAGMVGYWEREHNGEQAWETGWSVLPAYQGQGIATQANFAIIDQLRVDGRRRSLYAYPRIDHAASNAVCRKAGFVLDGVEEYEWPKGNPIQCNIWRYDLRG